MSLFRIISSCINCHLIWNAWSDMHDFVIFQTIFFLPFDLSFTFIEYYTIKKSWQMGSLITVEYWVLSSVQGLTLVSSDGCQGACPKDLQTNIPSYLPSHARLQLWINQFKKSRICFLKLIVKWFRRMFCSFMT